MPTRSNGDEGVGRDFALLFDADGVLVDSEPLVNGVLAEMLGELGLAVAPDEAERLFKGAHISQTIAQVEVELGRPVPDDFVREFRARSVRAFRTELEPVVGVRDAINRLSHLPRAVVSNGPPEKMAVSLSVTGLASLFAAEHVFSAYDIGAWKPEPTLLLHAAAALGVAPRRCVVIEDSAVGLEAARAAGMQALAYLPNGHSGPLPGGATAFRTMERLPELVGRLLDGL